jgi:DNA-directed RNA polymerase specialized sigma24 family protein
MQKQEASENLWATARRTLSVSQFTVLWLRYGEAMSIKEVATATGRTTVGVRVLLHRARAGLAPHVNHLVNTRSVASNDGRED